MFRQVSWDEVYQRMAAAPPGRLYGATRSGAVVAGLSGRATDRIEEADWLVLDVVDDAQAYGGGPGGAGKPVWALLDRARDGIGADPVSLPWDPPPELTGPERLARLEGLGRDLLGTLGYDHSQEGLRDTPGRWARWWEEFHGVQQTGVDTTFDVSTSGQLVTVSGIKVWSLCEHHLLPFVVEMTVGYIPTGRLLGLSKFARIAQRAAGRLQVQERLTEEVADAVEKASGTQSVAILARGRHLCMEARGVRSGASTNTLILRGAFETDAALRMDLYHLAGFSAPPALPHREPVTVGQAWHGSAVDGSSNGAGTSVGVAG